MKGIILAGGTGTRLVAAHGRHFETALAGL
jgi:dTDP-glucose pyrophosphorylase